METFAGLGIRLDGTGIGTKKSAGQEAAAVAHQSSALRSLQAQRRASNVRKEPEVSSPGTVIAETMNDRSQNLAKRNTIRAG